MGWLEADNIRSWVTFDATSDALTYPLFTVSYPYYWDLQVLYCLGSNNSPSSLPPPFPVHAPGKDFLIFLLIEKELVTVTESLQKNWLL